MSIIRYVSGTNEPMISIEEITEQWGNSGIVRIYDYNLTTGRDTNTNVNLMTPNRCITMPNPIKIDDGVHHIKITINEDTTNPYEENFYLYKKPFHPYVVQINTKTDNDRLKINIQSEIDLPSGRVYFMVEKHSFRFKFPDIKKNKNRYFVIKNPIGNITFFVDKFSVPSNTYDGNPICYPDKVDCVDYGIELRVNQK